MTTPLFHIRLRHFRTQAGLSVAELAARAGLQRTHLHALEGGRKQPTWDTVCRLAVALGVSTEAFRQTEDGSTEDRLSDQAEEQTAHRQNGEHSEHHLGHAIEGLWNRNIIDQPP